MLQKRMQRYHLSPAPLASRLAAGLCAAALALPALADLSPRTSTMNIYGVDDVHAGLPVSKLSAAVGFPVRKLGPSPSEGCDYYANEGRLPGVYFMVVDGELARIDVSQGSSIRTVSGIGVGSTKAQVLATYGDYISVEPGEYIGEYLIYTPKDAEDQDFLLIFETDDRGRVTQMRSGKEGPVRWVEGCA